MPAVVIRFTAIQVEPTVFNLSYVLGNAEMEGYEAKQFVKDLKSTYKLKRHPKTFLRGGRITGTILTRLRYPPSDSLKVTKTAVLYRLAA